MSYRLTLPRWARPPCRLQKCYSTEATDIIPKLRPNLFSTRKLPTNTQSIPLDTYPNPIFSYSKEDLISLKTHDLTHLLSIPYKSVSETDQFCFNVLEIIHENIVKNPAVAARYLRAIQDPQIRTTLLGCLRQYYKSDLLRRSMILYIDDPTSAETRKEILNTLVRILCNLESPPQEAVHMGLSYLHKLALTGTTNPYILFMPKAAHQVLMDHLPQGQRAQLYACLLQINMKFQVAEDFEKLKKSLLAGTNLEKLVARTGILDARWEHINKCEFDGDHKSRMVAFLTFNDLALFAEHAINEKDVVNANLYLDLLVSKFEGLGTSSKRLQTMLNTMLHHSMVFKGPQECIKFLEYMKESRLEIKISTLLRVLARLTEDRCWDEALFLINFLHTEKLDVAQRNILTKQIMKIITRKFHLHPQVAVGYFASIFSSSDNQLLQILRDLRILELVYGAGVTDTLFDMIKRADIHEDLKGGTLTLDILKDIYLVLLRNLSGEQRSNTQLIKQLFSEFMNKVQQADRLQETESIFHPENVSDDILSLFLDHLLRADPYVTDNMDLVADPTRYAAAKEMYLTFFTTARLSRSKRKVYVLDLMVTSSLLYHRDISFAAKLLKHARESGMPLSFNQLYPFIMYHYSKGEHEQARNWYDLLVQHGVKAKNASADRLIGVAKELEWPVKGTMYRSTAHQKNKKARQELAKLTKDPLVALGGAPTSHGVTGTERYAGDVDLVEQLALVLHAGRTSGDGGGG